MHKVEFCNSFKNRYLELRRRKSDLNQKINEKGIENLSDGEMGSTKAEIKSMRRIAYEAYSLFGQKAIDDMIGLVESERGESEIETINIRSDSLSKLIPIAAMNLDPNQFDDFRSKVRSMKLVNQEYLNVFFSTAVGQKNELKETLFKISDRELESGSDFEYDKIRLIGVFIQYYDSFEQMEKIRVVDFLSGALNSKIDDSSNLAIIKDDLTKLMFNESTNDSILMESSRPEFPKEFATALLIKRGDNKKNERIVLGLFTILRFIFQNIKKNEENSTQRKNNFDFNNNLTLLFQTILDLRNSGLFEKFLRISNTAQDSEKELWPIMSVYGSNRTNFSKAILEAFNGDHRAIEADRKKFPIIIRELSKGTEADISKFVNLFDKSYQGVFNMLFFNKIKQKEFGRSGALKDIPSPEVE